MTLEEIADSSEWISRYSHKKYQHQLRKTGGNPRLGNLGCGFVERRFRMYRSAELKLSQLLFLVIEPPDARYDYQEEKALWVDAGSEETPRIATGIQLPDPLPEGAFTHWFFVNDWNAFIHVAPMDARISLM